MRKILILGHGNHGKDTFASYLCKHLPGTSFVSSSEEFAKIFFEKHKEQFGYNSVEECYLDRRNHRELWKQEINLFNSKDKARLARRIYENSDVYVGMRAADEYLHTVAEFNPYVLWVTRKPVLEENDPTMAIPFNGATMGLIENNRDLGHLETLARVAALTILITESL